MKTIEDYIREIKINDANIDYIRHHPERKINGTLMQDIERVMEEYAQQQAIEFYLWAGYNLSRTKKDLKELYQKFKEEQK